jgi:hypothetical protein
LSEYRSIPNLDSRLVFWLFPGSGFALARGLLRIFAPLNSDPVPGLQTIEVATFFQYPIFKSLDYPAKKLPKHESGCAAAVEASGQEFPRKRVILNLSPASIRKRGTGLDLAMALSVLFIEDRSDFEFVAWGELGLDGRVKRVGADHPSDFRDLERGLKFLLVSEEDYRRAFKSLNDIGKAGYY